MKTKRMELSKFIFGLMFFGFAAYGFVSIFSDYVWPFVKLLFGWVDPDENLWIFRVLFWSTLATFAVRAIWKRIRSGSNEDK